MYPATYFQLFPAFPRRPAVFVAMSFDSQFERRWDSVIAPAIRRIAHNGVVLQPHRVDTRSVSDSILTEILDGIAHDAYILADISALAGPEGTCHRNPNVMYEVGIAHSLRLPEEVLLFRSDKAPLLFDVANIRVNSYDPDGNPAEASSMIERAFVNAGAEVNLRNLSAVRHTVASMDLPCWLALLDCAKDSGLRHPQMDTMGRILGSGGRERAIGRLLELGVLRSDLQMLEPRHLVPSADVGMGSLVAYQMTALGEAVLHHFATSIGIDKPELRDAVLALVAETEKQAAVPKP